MYQLMLGKLFKSKNFMHASLSVIKATKLYCKYHVLCILFKTLLSSLMEWNYFYFRLSRPLSENQINLIENTPPQQQREKRCTEFGKSGLSNLLRPKCPTKCGNISETSSLIVKGELFTAASQEGIEMESTSESTKI